MTFFEELKWRGMIKDISSPELEKKLNEGGLTFYIGADPTAESLHIGQLPTFLMIERLKRMGHKPIIVVGGATGRVGDPRGTGEREKADIKVLEHNFTKIKAQMKRLFGDDIEILNNLNYDTKDINKNINKELVKRQLEIGISYAEFSYMLIQGYDFKYIHDNFGATLQIGGSDQWGNITTGIELIRKLNNEEVYAFSMPLTVDSTGKKLGKSYGNALWLDSNKTSSYEMYQYILNFEDSMVEDYLKRYTFLSKDEIEKIMTEQNEAPHLRIAQKKLAEEIITFIHGKEGLESAIRITNALFSGNIKDLTVEEIEMAFSDLTPYEINSDINIVELLVDSGICKSKREAREFIGNGSIALNGEKITDLEFNITKSVAIGHKYAVIRRGKKKYYIIAFK